MTIATTTRTAAAARRHRPAPCCPTTSAAARQVQRQDLTVVWLYPDPADPDRIVERRHCIQCQPHAGIGSVDCNDCGDGPMLVGSLASSVHTTATPPAPVLAWLAERGWRIHPGHSLICPACGPSRDRAPA